MNNFDNFIINRESSCLQALSKLDYEKSNQTLFLTDQNERIVATVTDGDIRRGLIKGLNIDSPIYLFGRSEFYSINGNIDVFEIRRLKGMGIKVIPRLNESGQIVKIYNLSLLKSIIPVHAVILAGGRGERMRPLTDQTPKPMLPLGGKPILEHIIDRLISYGVETITIAVHYLSKQIMDYFGDGAKKGIVVNYIEEDVPLGTIGCLSLIEDLHHQSYLVLNADVFTSINFEDFYINFLNEKADMSVASIPYSVDIPYAIMDLKDNCIKSFSEKPKNTYYANAGIYLINERNLSYIPKNTFFNATDLMDCILADSKKLIHSPITGFWIDIGRHDDYKKAQEIIRHL
jgi:dTDP-glucose pyrophosphorylase